MVFPDSGHVFAQLSNGEVEPYWAVANAARLAICGENQESRRYALTRRLIDLVSRQDVDAGLALAAANPDLKVREGMIDVYAFRAWHRGAATAAERLLQFNMRQFPDSTSALWSLGEFYRYAGRKTAAVAAYQAFLNREPGDADALARIAELSGPG